MGYEHAISAGMYNANRPSKGLTVVDDVSYTRA